MKQTAEEVGLSAARVQHLVNVYSFMVMHKDNQPDRWSYYDEYLKSSIVKRVSVEQRKELDQVVVSKIDSREIPLAVDIRDKLPKIVSAGGKTLNRFLSGKKDFEQSYQIAIEQGAGNVGLKKLTQFRLWISDPEVEDDLCDLTGEPENKCVYELKKIHSSVERVLSKLQHRQP